MKITEKLSQLETVGTDWRRLVLRGSLLVLSGVVLAVAAAASPEVTILKARDFSLLPAVGVVLLILGGIECFDCAIASELKDFVLHLYTGVFDVVLGGLILLSLGGNPSRLSLAIVAFLIAKAIVRTVLAYVTHVRQEQSVAVGAAISILLACLIWAEWPSGQAWFLAFCLSVDTALRGWTVLYFALWVRNQQARHAASQ